MEDASTRIEFWRWITLAGALLWILTAATAFYFFYHSRTTPGIEETAEVMGWILLGIGVPFALAGVGVIFRWPGGYLLSLLIAVLSMVAFPLGTVLGVAMWIGLNRTRHYYRN